jgi:hypothetical protein
LFSRRSRRIPQISFALIRDYLREIFFYRIPNYAILPSSTRLREPGFENLSHRVNYFSRRSRRIPQICSALIRDYLREHFCNRLPDVVNLASRTWLQEPQPPHKCFSRISRRIPQITSALIRENLRESPLTVFKTSPAYFQKPAFESLSHRTRLKKNKCC